MPRTEHQMEQHGTADRLHTDCKSTAGKLQKLRWDLCAGRPRILLLDEATSASLGVALRTCGTCGTTRALLTPTEGFQSFKV